MGLADYCTISGIGSGGEFGVGMAMIAEAWPASKRARASSYVGVGWQIRVLAAAVLTSLLLPIIGWGGMLALSLFPAVAACLIRKNLHEPEVFVERAAHAPEEFSLRLLSRLPRPFTRMVMAGHC